MTKVRDAVDAALRTELNEALATLGSSIVSEKQVPPTWSGSTIRLNARGKQVSRKDRTGLC